MNEPVMQRNPLRSLPAGVQVLIIALLFAIAAGGLLVLRATTSGRAGDDTEISSRAHRPDGRFVPTSEQWATLTVEPVERRVFRPEHVTEGKVAIDEDHATPIFSPYAGRVTKLFAKPGDSVERGQPLFVV